MSQNLLKALDLLKDAITIKDPKKRKSVFEYLSKKTFVYKALREIAKNIMNKNIVLNTKQKRKINKHSKTIKKLAAGTDSNLTRKRLVQQSGGFLPWLLPLVATLVTTIANK